MDNYQKAASPVMTVQALRVEWSALAWMEGRTEPPKCRDETRLAGGGPKVGRFWNACKCERKCGRPPYDKLLSIPILKADYRIHRRGTS